MKILALDSTATSMSVALTEDTHLLSLQISNTGLTHSETLLPAIEHVLSHTGVSVSHIDLFAFTAGPGSFTGVRIGAATVKGLSLAQNKPCIEVSTLEALAYNLSGFDGLICPVMNARRSQVYNALFSCKDSKIERLTPDRAISISELEEELTAFSDKKIYLCGDGYGITLDALTKIRPADTPELLRYTNALSVAACALQAYGRGEAKSDKDISPTYLRPSQAERERNEKTRTKINKN